MLAIYEARPNVTSDIAALAFKSGNAVILRSGKECLESSKVIAGIYHKTLKEFEIDCACVSFVENSDRDLVQELLKLDEFIDVVVPRGGKDLIKAISKSTKIPLFKHLDGNCHSYIHKSANLEKAVAIVRNAKLRRTGVCGATESLVIDKKFAAQFLPKIIDQLSQESCEIRGDAAAQKIDGRIKKAVGKDFYTEYLDKIISVKIVKNIDEAIAHINKHSSSHTESIVTEDQNAADQFLQEINSAIVMHNASTQFADGGEFGLGAEVGISTGRLHARGPVGLEQLTTYKYVVEANCAIRA
jgi:glutamate-5-semialdehyde dehydrogenase